MHNAACAGDLLYIWGGGQQGAVPVTDLQLHVFNTSSNTWTQPTVKGTVNFNATLLFKFQSNFNLVVMVCKLTQILVLLFFGSFINLLFSRESIFYGN